MAKAQKAMDGDLKVEYWPIKRVISYARNSRLHSDSQVEAIAASIKEFGFVNPCLVDADGVLIAGHGRVLAMRKLERDKVPVIRLGHLTETQAKALRIADNQLPTLASWDAEMLRLELNDLKLAGYAMPLLGFDDVQLVSFMANVPTGTDPEATPEPPKDPVSRPGDMWQLGKHRLLCGDSTNEEDVARVLAGAKPNLCVTDQPYGVEYDADWRNDRDRANGKPYGARAVGKVENDDRADWRDAYVLFPGDVIYAWSADLRSRQIVEALESCNFQPRAQIIWVKDRLIIGRGDYHFMHEPCQPSGTMVQKVMNPRATANGRRGAFSEIEEVPIETLKAGDLVVSWTSNPSSKVFPRGRKVERIRSRVYTGNMHTVSVSGKKTRATAEHQFSVRMNPEKKFLTYVMRRGDRWRVGICGSFNSRGFGLAVRLSQELGDSAWIISVHDDMASARISEQVASCVYGIPTTHWEIDRNLNLAGHRDKNHIDQIYQRIGTDRIALGISRLFADLGLRLDYPLIIAGDQGSFSRVRTRIIRACNLVPGLMQLPIPTKSEAFEWETIDSVEFSEFKGRVWSMDVEIDQHYVADGIVAHNCWYAVRKGKKGNWAGDRKQTTVWEISHAKSDTGHSTQKPIECMRRPIQNNSKPGDYVYEPFSGSGTTIIAAEMMTRYCLAIELSPEYVDVAVQRWQDFAKAEATLIGDGRTFAEVAKARKKAPRQKQGASPKARSAKQAASGGYQAAQ